MYLTLLVSNGCCVYARFVPVIYVPKQTVLRVVTGNFVYILVKATVSTSTMCPNHYSRYFLMRMVYRSVYCTLTLIPLSSLTERTLDNQLSITLVRNDIPQVAIYQIVTFLMGNKKLKKLII